MLVCEADSQQPQSRATAPPTSPSPHHYHCPTPKTAKPLTRDRQETLALSWMDYFSEVQLPAELGRWEQDPDVSTWADRHFLRSPSSQTGQDLCKTACQKLGIHTQTKLPLHYPLLRWHHQGPQEATQVLLTDEPLAQPELTSGSKRKREHSREKDGNGGVICTQHPATNSTQNKSVRYREAQGQETRLLSRPKAHEAASLPSMGGAGTDISPLPELPSGPWEDGEGVGPSTGLGVGEIRMSAQSSAAAGQGAGGGQMVTAST